MFFLLYHLMLFSYKALSHHSSKKKNCECVKWSHLTIMYYFTHLHTLLSLFRCIYTDEHEQTHSVSRSGHRYVGISFLKLLSHKQLTCFGLVRINPIYSQNRHYQFKMLQ